MSRGVEATKEWFEPTALREDLILPVSPSESPLAKKVEGIGLTVPVKAEHIEGGLERARPYRSTRQSLFALDNG